MNATNKRVGGHTTYSYSVRHNGNEMDDVLPFDFDEILQCILQERTIWSSDMHKRLWKVCLDDPVSVRPKRSVEWEREGLGRGLRSLLLLSVDCTHISTRSCWNLYPICCIHAIIF